MERKSWRESNVALLFFIFYFYFFTYCVCGFTPFSSPLKFRSRGHADLSIGLGGLSMTPRVMVGIVMTICKVHRA